MWALFYFIKDINNKTAKSLENGLMPWSRGLIIVINTINYLFLLSFLRFAASLTVLWIGTAFFMSLMTIL